MKNLLIMVLAALLLMACAHGKSEHFPTVDNPAESAEVYVIRNNNLFGWGFSLAVLLDDKEVARLRSGEHVAFYVSPGSHDVNISKSNLQILFTQGRKYYFLISADLSNFGFEIHRIDNSKGEQWVAKTKRLE